MQRARLLLDQLGQPKTLNCMVAHFECTIPRRATGMSAAGGCDSLKQGILGSGGSFFSLQPVTMFTVECVQKSYSRQFLPMQGAVTAQPGKYFYRSLSLLISQWTVAALHSSINLRTRVVRAKGPCSYNCRSACETSGWQNLCSNLLATRK